MLEQRLVRVVSIRDVAIDTRAFELAAADHRPLAAFEPGAHIDVHAPSGQVRQYSLCGDPRDASRYTIAVKREQGGRGGSRSMHDDLETGSALGIVEPRNFFPLSEGARHSVFIAGGIGITPIRAMIHALEAAKRSWELHYGARSQAHAAYYDELAALGGSRVHAWFGETPAIDARALLLAVPDGAHVYCCGPAGLMAAVKEATAHWPEGRVHFEYFAAPARDDPPNRAFEVELRASGLTVEVPADRTILQVVRDRGIEVQSACEEGVCGTCETRVLEGACEHRDVLLTQGERAAGKSMMICVSRAASHRLVLDL